ncbi:hypothetical protein ACHAW6_002085, partial [Cyclotella cf. meneghiniana]
EQPGKITLSQYKPELLALTPYQTGAKILNKPTSLSTCYACVPPARSYKHMKDWKEYRSQNHDSRQTKLINRKWRRQNHRHFQVPTSLPPRSCNLKHRPHHKSYSTTTLHNSRLTRCTIG